MTFKTDKKLIGIENAISYFLDRHLGPDYSVKLRTAQTEGLTSCEITVTITKRCPPPKPK